MYYGARYYDPALGRFITPDTVYDAGTQGLNRYSYALNNPLIYVDPSGHWTQFFYNTWMRRDTRGVFPNTSYERKSIAGYLADQLAFPEHGSGTAEGFVPVWGSGKDTIFAFRERKILWAMAFGAMTVSDVTGAGELLDVLKAGVKSAGKFLAEETGEQLVKNVANEFGERALKAIPHGFNSADEFLSFGDELYAGLRQAGVDDVEALFQGSAVTGKKFTTGQPFDVGRISDFDIALSSPQLLEKADALGISLRSKGTRTAPLKAIDLEKLGLSQLNQTLRQRAGRPVNFMIFQSFDTALSKAPSILIPKR